MVKKIEDGGPAFPTDALAYEGAGQGMTLRDWYAGMALQSIYQDKEAEPTWRRRQDIQRLEGKDVDTYADWVAFLSYQLADSMLKARGHEE